MATHLVVLKKRYYLEQTSSSPILRDSGSTSQSSISLSASTSISSLTDNRYSREEELSGLKKGDKILISLETFVSESEYVQVRLIKKDGKGNPSDNLDGMFLLPTGILKDLDTYSSREDIRSCSEVSTLRTYRNRRIGYHKPVWNGEFWLDELLPFVEIIVTEDLPEDETVHVESGGGDAGSYGGDAGPNSSSGPGEAGN